MILKTLQRQGHALASPAEQVRVLNDPRLNRFAPFGERIAAQFVAPSNDLTDSAFNADSAASGFVRKRLETLQVNVGRVCNQTCSHCHVDAGPERRESMSRETAQDIMAFLKHSQVDTLDITGGAPEMNPNFRWLVEQARSLGKQVIDRCNLTILLANGFRELPEFLAEQRVTIVASLPCYLEQNCDAQRGDGVFQQSLLALARLNALGYGADNSGLELNLVYNPVGLGLPPEQQQLEQTYRTQLSERYQLVFNNLYTITNLPISRFLDDLLRQQQYELYMQRLLEAFNPATVTEVMCRSLVSVDWNGYLFDCDFNQMLDLPLMANQQRLHISQVRDEDLLGRTIQTANHCYGCTAGCGSSCSGSLT